MEPTKRYQITRIADLDMLAPRRDEWNALAARSATHTIYQTFEWNASWWHAFGAGAQALVLLVEEDGQLVGIAPLVLSKRRVLGRRRRVLDFFGATLFVSCDFILDPQAVDVLSLMLQWLYEHRTLWSLALLQPCPNPATIACAASYFGARGHATHRQALDDGSSRVMGDAQSDHKAYSKQTMRKGLNALRRQGDVRWVRCTDVQEALGLLTTFGRLHIQRWAGTDTPSLFRRPAYLRFHQELVCAMAAAGWLYLSALLIDDKPIALSLAFDYDQRVFLFAKTFDLQWAAYSPGLVTLHFQLLDAVERGVSEVDLGRGNQEFKAHYANQHIPHAALWVWRHALTGRIDLGLLALLGWVERHPRLEHARRRLIRPFYGHHV